MTDFIEGKWYKNIGADDNCYAKVLKIDGEKLYIEYSVDLNRDLNTYNPNEAYFSKESYRKAKLLEDLTEIDPYLPEGHPDKKFVLPECWYIQLTEENQGDVEKWHKTKDEWSRAYTLESYYGLKNGNGDAWQIGCLPENSNVITYNQFKKYVLNQQKENFSYLDKLLSKWNIK